MTERYYAALEALEPEAHLLFFAQALEAARELLPGQNKVEKQAQMPAGLAIMMKRPLDSLFEISNARRQTRHLITKQGGLAPHPEMDDTEVTDFQHDADLVIRYVASKQLGLPFMVAPGGVSGIVA